MTDTPPQTTDTGTDTDCTDERMSSEDYAFIHAMENREHAEQHSPDQ